MSCFILFSQNGSPASYNSFKFGIASFRESTRLQLQSATDSLLYTDRSLDVVERSRLNKDFEYDKEKHTSDFQQYHCDLSEGLGADRQDWERGYALWEEESPKWTNDVNEWLLEHMRCNVPHALKSNAVVQVFLRSPFALLRASFHFGHESDDPQQKIVSEYQKQVIFLMCDS